MASNAPVQEPLRSPAVTALRQEALGSELQRVKMERSLSEDFRMERDDLKEAVAHSQNVILDLSLDGTVRFVSPSWQDLIGTPPSEVIGKAIADILPENKTAFEEGVEALKKDDSKSQIIRFSLPLGPLSSLRKKLRRSRSDLAELAEEEIHAEDQADAPPAISLEAQGIMIYNSGSGEASHTMWMIRPYVLREVTIDLPPVLVESLGVGAEMLARHLTELAEAVLDNPGEHPPPPPVLCRICERQITPWWFEKHTELCLQEHRAEMDVQLAHESLSEHRSAIVNVLDALESRKRQSRAPASGELALPTTATAPPEYKGMPIGPSSTPSSGPSSGRASPAESSRSRDRSSGFGHARARSFAVRRPVARIVELVLDLCDTALEINTPSLRTQPDGEFRTQSPQSENRISQVLQWERPSTSTMEQEQGLSALCEDTASLARAKVEAVFRHRRILEYAERIRVEFDVLVQECIEAALEKAARIANGDTSDSSSDNESQIAAEESHVEEFDTEPQSDAASTVGEEGVFPASLENPSSMSLALRNASEMSLSQKSDPRSDRRVSRVSSTAASSRSNSPRGAATPRSHMGTSIPPPSKRGSIYFESDTGADSDGSMASSAISLQRRAESPSSEVSLARVHSSRDRKRRSLILPSVMSSRGQSPARSIPPPHSPLRMNKPRLPSGADQLQSPITSPVLSHSDFSSPSIFPQHLHHNHHRRQSSAASSQVLGPPLSPRLAPVASNPQPKAVPPSIRDFEIIKPISKGAFGSVYLSKKKSTGDYFAVKVLKKSDMVAKNQITNVKAERAIMMVQGESDFVAKLYWTFSSKEYLYLVMEYLNGGDCASLIKTLGGLPEDWTKKYIAEVVLGVEHLHSRGIVHRDLKPDNLLIDAKGHLKLTDFGLSRMGLVGRQKRALQRKGDEPPVPDLLKQGPFQRAVSSASSRSASFDLHGKISPTATPSLTAISQNEEQPSYFSLSREPSSRRISSSKGESENGDSLQAMFRRFSIADDVLSSSSQPVEDDGSVTDTGSPDPYPLQPIVSNVSTATQSQTPPATAASSMLPPTMALFDPADTSRKFVGTPDYLAPETISGVGQDEVSDWWSVGCMIFEFLYGYPPFHGESPEEVFQNILARKIDWPSDEDCPVSEEVKDIMNKLMCSDPTKRLGANPEDKFASGGEEIRKHRWFADLNWDTLREDDASFVPAPENAEDTEYFDSRGATLQSFAPEFEDQSASSAGTPGADYLDRPHDALSKVRTQINSMKRGLMPLHIPPHVRDGRSRRLSEPVAADDFGSFSFKNLPVLEKANKDVIQKLRAEAMQAQAKSLATASTAVSSPAPSLESSPILPMPLKRTLSSTKGQRPSSPLLFQSQPPSASPNRMSQPSSPLLVQFSAQQSERRKTSSGSSSLSHQSSNSLQPGSFFDAPRMTNSVNMKVPLAAVSPIKLSKSPVGSQDKSSMAKPPLPTSAALNSSPRARSHTISSQESEDVIKELVPKHYKRRSQALDVSPSSSDTEEQRQQTLLRVQRRRQSSRRLSRINIFEGPYFRPLDVLICEDHPVSRLVMEKLMEKLRCRTISTANGAEALGYATSEVKFDIIFLEYKLPGSSGTDVARMVRDTRNVNSSTPIVCVTGYLKDLPPEHHFDGLIDKPPTLKKLQDILGKLCQWAPPPPGWTPTPYQSLPLSGLRTVPKMEDSPTSNSSVFGSHMPSSSYRGSSRQDSISSSFFGDTDGKIDDIPVYIKASPPDSWTEGDLTNAFGGLGITEATAEPKSRPVSVPSLSSQMSAPASLEVETIRRKPSAERIKKRISTGRGRDAAESGDDEDEELGHVQIRTKSPRAGRIRGSSKLGYEMMRTNSRGSVISVEDVAGATDSQLPSSPPPAIKEVPKEEDKATLTPPEVFPRLPGTGSEDIEMDSDEITTPRPFATDAAAPDPDPTPRSSITGLPAADAVSPSPSPK